MSNDNRLGRHLVLLFGDFASLRAEEAVVMILDGLSLDTLVLENTAIFFLAGGFGKREARSGRESLSTSRRRRRDIFIIVHWTLWTGV